jgi:renalase
MRSCVIIGAGMTGLMAARTLHDAGWQVTVVDRGYCVGGRMSTRHIGTAVFDQGAQFFMVRDPRCQTLVRAWMDAGVCQEWCRGFLNAKGVLHNDGQPRYRGVPYMRAIPEYLAQDLTVHSGVTVASIVPRDGGWSVRAEGQQWTADAVVCTTPMPQTSAILAASDITLPQQLQASLAYMVYDPCLAVMAAMQAPSAIDAPGGVLLAGEPVHWIADNYEKGISPQRPTLTIHAGPIYSRTHWRRPSEEVGRELLRHTNDWYRVSVIAFQIMRWAYSRPVVTYPERYAWLETPAPLALAGDAFGGARVEGAMVSGMAVAEALLTRHNS